MQRGEHAECPVCGRSWTVVQAVGRAKGRVSTLPLRFLAATAALYGRGPRSQLQHQPLSFRCARDAGQHGAGRTFGGGEPAVTVIDMAMGHLYPASAAKSLAAGERQVWQGVVKNIQGGAVVRHWQDPSGLAQLKFEGTAVRDRGRGETLEVQG